MTGVLVGYTIIATIIVVGYLIERVGLLGQGARLTLNRLTFFVTTPALLFSVVSVADLRELFSSQLAVALISFVAAFLVYIAVSSLLFKRDVFDSLLGGSAASYVNSNNIGLPVAIYVVGSAQAAAPILIMQVVLITPILLMLLDFAASGTLSVKQVILKPFKNPMIVASLLGVLVSGFKIDLPPIITEPFEIIGHASIPLILMAFGMSLRGQRPLEPGSPKAKILIASLIKLIIMPLIAWLVAVFVFGLSGAQLYAAVVMAALPTAQNVFNFAVRYGHSVALVRDTALLTTIASFPILLLLAAFLT